MNPAPIILSQQDLDELLAHAAVLSAVIQRALPLGLDRTTATSALCAISRILHPLAMEDS